MNRCQIIRLADELSRVIEQVIKIVENREVGGQKGGAGLGPLSVRERAH